MRTSRISRQTAHVVETLSPKKRLRATITRSSQRTEGGAPDAEEPDTESSLSTPPQTPTKDESEIASRTSGSARKRKRNSPKALSKVASETTSIRMKPRRSIERPKKARRQPARPVKDDASSTVKVEPPPNWEEVYRSTQDMRRNWQAPVDTMGCESLAENKRTPRDRRFQTLTALMLSSQTKDGVTAAAMKNLQDGLPGGFTLESILAVEPNQLNSLINKVGFHNNKTKYIKAAAEIMASRHKSDIPDTIEGLVALPGVGPKMAYLCMSAAWGRDEGIGVDVHVHRITNLWGWHKTQTPEETRAALESWLPREKWHDINHLLVGFGQTWCPPVGRKCDECKLALGLCPSAVLKKTVKTKVKKEGVAINDKDGAKYVEEKIDAEVDIERVKAEDLAKDETTRGLQDIEDIGGRSSTRRSKRFGRKLSF